MKYNKEFYYNNIPILFVGIKELFDKVNSFNQN